MVNTADILVFRLIFLWKHGISDIARMNIMLRNLDSYGKNLQVMPPRRDETDYKVAVFAAARSAQARHML